jgi:hypothetical protein
LNASDEIVVQDSDPHPDPLAEAWMRGSRSGSPPKCHGSVTLLASSCFSVNGSSFLPCAIAWLLLDKKGNSSTFGGNSIDAASVFDNTDSRTLKLRETQRNLFPTLVCTIPGTGYLFAERYCS